MEYKKYLKWDKKILIIGFGSVGQAILPLLFRHLDIKSDQISIITKNEDGAAIAAEFGAHFLPTPVTRENYHTLIGDHLEPGDFLLNLSVDVSSLDLIKLCQQKGALYLDTCIEPWKGGYVDPTLPSSSRSNYAMRESVLALRNNQANGPTALITHGANPGLASHLLKQALLNIAKDNHLSITPPKTPAEWAALAELLTIKVIHIAERDTQITDAPKQHGEFVNTWSVDGFVAEGLQPAELGWGSHERYWPEDGYGHETGSQCSIYLNRPGASTRVRTWTPLAGPFHGFLITHAESISIADYLTIKKENDELHYRPTVHYAYHPCEDAVLSLHELAGREWQQQEQQRLLFREIIDGTDELGVLLMGNAKGAYWFGSQLSIHEARALITHNNATSLQVAISVLAGMLWVIEHPHRGIVEPEEVDHHYILEIALPYLGQVQGHYTDWTPLQEREKLFPENVDWTDPWQFINIRVS